MNIASQIYAFIDRHINHLDTDLAELDAEIEAERKELGLQPEETACSKLGLKLAEVCPQHAQRRRITLKGFTRYLSARTRARPLRPFSTVAPCPHR